MDIHISKLCVQLYIEGYLQGMLDVSFKLEYLRVRVIDDQVYSCLILFWCPAKLQFF